MNYFYMINPNKDPLHCLSMVTELLSEMREYATTRGFIWLNEDEALAMRIEIPNSSGHYGIITRHRTWEVPTKIKDNAIWCYWLISAILC